MDLKTFMKSLSPDERKQTTLRLAEKANVSVAAIKQYIYRTRNCPPHRALLIEEELNGRVTAQEIVFGSKSKAK